MSKGFLALIVVVVVLAAGLFMSQRSSGPLKVSGFLEADEIRLGSRVGGRVSKVNAVEGQRVQKDEVLVELDPFDLIEQRSGAEALLAERTSQLKLLEAGYRQEEVLQARSRVEQWTARVEQLVNGPRKQDIASAEARLTLAEAQLALAQNEHERRKRLAGSNVTTVEELDRATNELRAAEATLQVRQSELALLREGTRKEEIDVAKAQLAEAGHAFDLLVHGTRKEEIDAARAAVRSAQAALRAFDRQIDELSIRAAGLGVVEAIDLQAGELVQPNAPVITVMDASSMWVRAYVPENRLDVKVGDKVAIQVDSYPEERFAGEIVFVARQAEFTPGNVQTPEERSKQVFRIKVVIREGRDRLRAGMAADVVFDGGTADSKAPAKPN